MLERLLTHLRTVAPDCLDVDILQPADPFLETAGEDLRRRIFITESIDGVVHCLRPEFTIPLCLAHVAEGKQRTGGSARYAYGGTVFRQARSGAAEFQQVGLEDLGSDDRVDADMACIRDLLSCLGLLDLGKVEIALGDQDLFAVVVESLQLPQAIARRLVRSFGAAELLETQLDRLTAQKSSDRLESEAEQLARAGNTAELVAHVEAKMRAASLAVHAGRSPQAIAERMIERVREHRFQLDGDSADILRRYLALEVPLARASEALQIFATETGLSFGRAGKDFIRRIDVMEQAGLDLDCISYKASLGRNLEYYTGVLFEASVAGVAVAGGGRYDRLCSLLGAANPVPAVGFSISLDRLEEVQ